MIINKNTQHPIDKRMSAAATLLMDAIIDGTTVEHVEKLIGEGVDVNEKDVDGWTFLIPAVLDSGFNNSEDVVKLFLEYGTDANTEDTCGVSVLMYASENSCKSSTEKTVRLLIEFGACLDMKDVWGQTALMYAASESCSNSTENTVKILLESGAKVEDILWAIKWTVKDIGRESSTRTITMLIEEIY